MDPELGFAQDAIRCETCKESAAKVTCHTCQINLCGNCVGKHVTSYLTNRHDLIEFRKCQPLLPICRIHTQEKCDMFCTQCHVSICSQCVSSGAHKTHDIRTMLEIYKAKRELFQDEANVLETKIAQEYEKHISEMEERISKLKEKYEKLTTYVVKEGKIWHDEVDVVVNSFLKKIEKMKTEDLSIVLKNLEEFKNRSTKVRERIEKLYVVMNSADVNVLLDMESCIKRFQAFPERFDFIPPTFAATKRKVDDQFGILSKSFKFTIDAYSLDILEKFGASEKQVLDDTKSIATVDGTCRPLKLVKAINKDEVWVCGNDNTLKRINMKGDELDRVNPADSSVFDFTVNSKGRVIFLDTYQSSVKIVIDHKSETLIKLQDWIPVAICISKCGELIVGMRSIGDFQGKIVRFSGVMPKQEIQFDEEGKSLFLGVKDRINLYLAENRNKDVCVTDAVSLSVMVVNEDGEIRFRYTGKILASKMSKSFQPGCIVTDSKGQIIVADTLNHMIHIIDEDGAFVSFIACNLNYPTGLSISEDDSLFVAEYITGKIKKLQYLC